MNKIVIKAKDSKKFNLYCPFTNEKLDNDGNSFEIYEGAGNYIFSLCDDCLFYDAGNNDELDRYLNNSAEEAVEKFVQNHSEENILIIEILQGNEKFFFGFLNEENIELSKEEIENRFIK